MKIVSKAYLLIVLLISVAAFNLFLLYQEDQLQVSQSYLIIRTGEVKVKAESIASSAASVASGDFNEKANLQKEIEEVQSILGIIKDGGVYKNQFHNRIPTALTPDYNKITSAWESYKLRVGDIETTSRFDPEAIRTLEYVLDKNQEMVLLTDQLVNDLSRLDRDYNAHKQIAKDMTECVKVIGEQALLIRTGEEFTSQ